jgi:glycosyltransferase involved in cell wall biosynthesis
MNILLATPTFPPFKDGVAQASAAQAYAFAAEGHKVCVATEPHPDRRSGTVIDRIAVREFRILGSPHFRHPYHGDTARYIDHLKQASWDAIIFHSYSWPLLLASSHLSHLRAKKILVSHGYGALIWTPVRRFPFGLGSWLWSFVKSMEMLRWYKQLNRVVYLDSKIDARAFYDHFLARLCQHKGIRVIPNGVELPVARSDHFAQSFLDCYHIPRATPLFLSVANYSWRKDQGFAARAFRRAAIPGSKLVFIGSEFNECSDAFRMADSTVFSESDPRDIIWLEKVSREHTLGALQACDAFVLSANHEAQPIVLLEAMSYGKPWIAREAGCIDRMAGGLCVRSVRDMAKAMWRIAGDSALRHKLRAEGRRAAEIQHSSHQYAVAYCQLLKERL